MKVLGITVSIEADALQDNKKSQKGTKKKEFRKTN